MSAKVFAYLVEFAGRYDKRLLKGASSRPPQRFEIPEFNSWVECKSIENVSSLLGEELDLVIFDEASRFPAAIYERYIAARLASRQGKLFSISTPFGKNWFYRNHLKADAHINMRSIDNIHWHSNHNECLKEAETTQKPIEETCIEWVRAKERLPEMIFKQEYEAKFLDDAASVFRKITECVGDTLRDVEYGHSYVMGVDLGKVEDFTVLTIVDRQTGQVVYFDRFNKIDYTFQKARILSVAQRYNNAKITIDSTSVGIPIKEDLERAGAYVDDYTFSNKSKKELIEKLSISLEQRAVRIPRIQTLIEELEAFGYRLTDAGNIIYSAPDGLHDDCVYSLALAVWSLSPYAQPRTDMLKEMLRSKPKNQQTSFI